MTSHASFYQVTSVIWAVVSDGKQAYGFKYQKDETVFKDKIFVLHGNKDKQPDAKIDRAEPARKVANETVKNFISTIALKLEEAFAQNAFDYVVIVAPRKTLDALKEAVSENVRSRLLANMPEGYLYDKRGAIFAMREEATVQFTSYTDAICRSLPPCCTRSGNSSESRVRVYGSTGKPVENGIYIVQ
jgi:protein required for attachment to host cells